MVRGKEGECVRRRQSRERERKREEKRETKWKKKSDGSKATSAMCVNE